MAQISELPLVQQEEEPSVEPRPLGGEFYSGKIYCANCIHCKLIPAKDEGETRYVLRIRCAAGKWKKKLGEEKLYKYNTIFRRCFNTCDSYEEMGDTREFIRDLRKTLPNKDEPFFLVHNDGD
jgi:hypothetical protein